MGRIRRFLVERRRVRMLRRAAAFLSPERGLRLYAAGAISRDSLWDGIAAGVAVNIELATGGAVRSYDLLRRGAS